MSVNASIIDDLKYEFRYGGIVNKLVLINVIIFLLFAIVKIFFFFAEQNEAYEAVMRWLYFPASPMKLLTRPWTLISYQFLHGGFLHILFNMLWLYWMGRILVQYTSENRIIALYIFGGIAGAVLFMLAYNLLPVFSPSSNMSVLLGASASVMAIVLATATLLPDYEIKLFLLGFVKLKYIALVAVLLDIVTLDGNNPGGHIAHLGGAFFGWLFITQLRKGNDWSKPIDWIMNKFSKQEKGYADMKVAYKADNFSNSRSEEAPSEQEVIDAILDKMLASGNDINALTKEEREILNRASKDT